MNTATTSQISFAENRIATSAGVKGTREPGSDLLCFRGIPFAEPPVGELRFAPPQRCGWLGVRRRTGSARARCSCPCSATRISASNRMSEDCLYLDEDLNSFAGQFQAYTLDEDGSAIRLDNCGLVAATRIRLARLGSVSPNAAG